MLRFVRLSAVLVGCNEPIEIAPRDDKPARSKPRHANYRTLTGKDVSIADDDTLTVLDDSKTQHRIRLQGIDTPERRQAFGTKAREALAGKVFQ